MHAARAGIPEIPRVPSVYDLYRPVIDKLVGASIMARCMDIADGVLPQAQSDYFTVRFCCNCGDWLDDKPFGPGCRQRVRYWTAGWQEMCTPCGRRTSFDSH